MTPWERLGKYVVSRRVQLRYKTRQPFADALGISLRTLGDLETGRREKYEPNTIAALENALGWAAGSVDDIVAGGEPTLNPMRPDAANGATTTADNAADPDEALRRVMLSDLPDDRKRLIVEILIDQKRDAERQRVAHAVRLIQLARGED
jgi:transcriptional regulator with XRE-family HTH domain